MTAKSHETQIVEALEAELRAAQALPVVMEMPVIADRAAEALACEIVNFRYVRLLTALLEIVPRTPENGFIRVEDLRLLENMFCALERNEAIIPAYEPSVPRSPKLPH